jgi:hypothetical protein
MGGALSSGRAIFNHKKPARSVLGLTVPPSATEADVVLTAAATGVLPLDDMLSVMRDAAADHKRSDAMAATPYLPLAPGLSRSPQRQLNDLLGC